MLTLTPSHTEPLPLAETGWSLPATLPGGRPWPGIAVVVRQDGPGTDESVASIEQQGYPQVDIVLSEGARGGALNLATQRAGAEIVAVLDAGERLAPGALAAVAMAFADSGAAIVAGICTVVEGDGEEGAGHLTACSDAEGLPVEGLLDLEQSWSAGQFFRGPEVFYARSALRRTGAVDEQVEPAAADYDLHLRLGYRGAVLHVIGRRLAVAPARGWEISADVLGVRERFIARTGRRWAPASAPARALRESLRIAMLNDHGFRYGAGIAHGRLATAIALGGHAVAPIAMTSDMPYDPTGAVTCSRLVETVRQSEADLVVMGNVHSAATDGRVVEAVARQFPSAFVLHDLWMLTGRCAYAGDCQQYLSAEGCDAGCPTAEEYPRLPANRIHDAWQFKRALLHAEHAPVLLANSRWMLETARRVLAVPMAHLGQQRSAASAAIRLAFPVKEFTPQDKRAARQKLGLPQDRFLLLFSASSLDDRRKGVAHLMEAMRLLNLPDVTTVCVGRYDADAQPDLPDLRMMGYMNDPGQLSTLYSAVDLFVGPSLEEALGQVYIEAAACGTPSVGYPVGGVPEAVLDGITGRLATAVSPAALAEAIREMHANPDLRRDMGRWGRMVTENEWSQETALHRWHTALQTTGLAQRIGLARRIRIVPDPQSVPPAEPVPPQYPAWRAVSGFGPWEGPYPQWRLPRCRWLLAPTAVLEIPAETEGVHRVMIECYNSRPGQRLSLQRVDAEGDGDQAALTRHIPATPGGNAFVAMFNVRLQRGWNRLDVRCEKWHEVPGTGHKQGVLVSAIICRPWTE